jgi:hypothetical protein
MTSSARRVTAATYELLKPLTVLPKKRRQHVLLRLTKLEDMAAAAVSASSEVEAANDSGLTAVWDVRKDILLLLLPIGRRMV